jgi:hypothetical protein
MSYAENLTAICPLHRAAMAARIALLTHNSLQICPGCLFMLECRMISCKGSVSSASTIGYMSAGRKQQWIGLQQQTATHAGMEQHGVPY